MSVMLRIGVGLIAWATALGAVLSIANLPGDWGHSICGPWGCGPPQQALLACHLAWLVILAPPAAMVVRSGQVPAHVLRRFGSLLCVLAVISIATVMVYQRIAWWPSVSDWQRGFFWQRCGFVLATAIDLPVAQILLIGTYLSEVGRKRNVKQLTEPPLV